MYFTGMLEILGVPKRPAKPREKGITMVLDKLVPIDRDYLEEAAHYIDVVKIGWTLSSTVSRSYLEKRIRLYKELGIEVSSGGTILELAYAKKNVDRLLSLLKELGFDIVEVSNGILNLMPEEKRLLIKKARLAGFKVVAEVGKKNPSYRMGVEEAIAEAKRDLSAGAWKVIVEGREMGKATCIFDEEGEILWERVNSFLSQLPGEALVFEAPRQEQQIELILNIGPEVNLANVDVNDVLPLETLRLGIRGDTYLLGRERPLDVSPSARFVYYVLRERGPLTIRELQEHTGLSRRTIHNVLRELRSVNAVKTYGNRGREKLWGIT